MSENRMTALTKPQLEAATKEAKEQRDRIFDLAKAYKKDWVELWSEVVEFKNSVRSGRRRYELSGYASWEEFLAALGKVIGEGRSEMCAKINAVERLPGAVVRQLGKTKCFQAARLVKYGKWTEERKARLIEMSADQAKVYVAKAVGTDKNGYFRLVEILRDGQDDLWRAEKERIMGLLATDSNEAFWDFLLGLLHNLPESEITGKKPK